MAPNTAIRIVAISVRAKFMVPSAAPRSWVGTVFCSETCVSGAVGPKPIPIRKRMISNLTRAHRLGRQAERDDSGDADAQKAQRQHLVVAHTAEKLAGKAGAGVEREHEDYQGSIRMRSPTNQAALQIHRQEKCSG